MGAALVAVTGLADAVSALKRIERPFLNWTGKSRTALLRRPEPAFERLSTKAIIETPARTGGPTIKPTGSSSTPILASR